MLVKVLQRSAVYGGSGNSKTPGRNEKKKARSTAYQANCTTHRIRFGNVWQRDDLK